MSREPAWGGCPVPATGTPWGTSPVPLTPTVSTPPFRSFLLCLHLHVFTYRAARGPANQQTSPSLQNRLCDFSQPGGTPGGEERLAEQESNARRPEGLCPGQQGTLSLMPALASPRGLQLGEATGDQVRPWGQRAAPGRAMWASPGPNRQEASPF